ncbi:MAG: hypothetical protein HOM21_06795 [Halobacteriovoraceae bacterium]|jgi:hypothetical protein|nr:hypothetical protein [Halobacteriovoraceae bacterium]
MKKYKILLYLIICTFSSLTYSSDELRGFCFKAGVSLDKAKATIRPLLLKKDRVYKREALNCLEVKLSPMRKDLIERYLRQRVTLTRVYDGATGGSIASNNKPAVTRNCLIEIARHGDSSLKQSQAKLAHKSFMRHDESKKSGVLRTQMLLGAGMPGHLDVEGERVELLCSPRGTRNFQITVSIKSPANGQSISSSVGAGLGNPINIGNMVQNLKDQSHSLGLPAGAEIKRVKSALNFSYFLTVVR